jgi:hypothetical protein
MIDLGLLGKRHPFGNLGLLGFTSVEVSWAWGLFDLGAIDGDHLIHLTWEKFENLGVIFLLDPRTRTLGAVVAASSILENF